MSDVRLTLIRLSFGLVERSSQVDIRIPLFKDENTPEFLRQNKASSINGEGGDGPLAPLQRAIPPTIHMDAMAFGMGCCCLQVTFQVCIPVHLSSVVIVLMKLSGT